MSFGVSRLLDAFSKVPVDMRRHDPEFGQAFVCGFNREGARRARFVALQREKGLSADVAGAEPVCPRPRSPLRVTSMLRPLLSHVRRGRASSRQAHPPGYSAREANYTRGRSSSLERRRISVMLCGFHIGRKCVRMGATLGGGITASWTNMLREQSTSSYDLCGCLPKPPLFCLPEV